MKKSLLATLPAAVLSLLALAPLACVAAESEAMQRERALNGILVAERQAREQEAAARGHGLVAMNAAPVAAKQGQPAATKKGSTRKQAAGKVAGKASGKAAGRATKPGKAAKPAKTS